MLLIANIYYHKCHLALLYFGGSLLLSSETQLIDNRNEFQGWVQHIYSLKRLTRQEMKTYTPLTP